MDVFARLLDVAPDGTALRIARGQVHITDAVEPAVVDIDLGQLGYRVREGHRLRLHVHSSDFPEFLPQPRSTPP
jgi:predicted acyl esterase